MSDVTRSMNATTTPAAATVARQRQTQPNGWWGAALFVATEAALFGSILGTYFYLRFKTEVWPPQGIEPPDVVLPLSLTAALVATSVPVFLAVRAAKASNAAAAGAFVILAVLIQAGYVAVQVILFKEDLGKFSPRDTAYASIYFTMLAAHHAHVIFGILLELAVLVKLAGGLTNYRLIGVRAIALYWYLVNGLAVLVVLTQLSPSL